MIIIYNLIALGIGLVAFVIALAIGHLLGMTQESQLFLIGAPVAMVLDILYRIRTGRWFHPRGGGALFFIPVWLLGLLVLPVSAATFLGAHGKLPQSFPSVGASSHTFDSPPRVASEAEGKREALRRYPSLGVANSPLNLEFLRRYRQYQQQKPEFFRNPAWPVTLAQECAGPLGL